MSYKVNYYTLAKMDDGRIGNIKQSTDHAFTDCVIEKIPERLNEFLAEKKRVAVIEKIENVGGCCV